MPRHVAHAEPGARKHGRHRRRTDGGSATVEFAMVLPTAAILMGALWAGAMWTVAALRVQDAAAVAARVAITQPEAAVVDAAQRVAGGGTRASVRREGAWVHVDVTGAGHGWLPDVEATASTWVGP